MARLKASLNLWSLPATLSWEEALAEVAIAGFDAIEPNLEKQGWVTPETSAADLAALAAAARRAGLEIASLSTGLLWETSLTAPEADERRRAREYVARQITAAAALETDTVLVVPGAVDVFFAPGRPRVRYDHAMVRLLAALEDLVPLAEREGITLALETVWNRFLLSPLEMRDLVDRFDSPRLGVYVDVGNLQALGYPQDWIDILGHRVARVHAKGYRRSLGLGTSEGFTTLLAGEVDWPEVVAALGRAGYGRYLTAELYRSSRMPLALFLEQTARELRWIASLAEGLPGAGREVAGRGRARAAGPRAGRKKKAGGAPARRGTAGGGARRRRS